MNCIVCNARSYNEYCFRHKKHKRISRYGRVAQRWTARRRQWILEHPTETGTWACYLCGKALILDELTLDHIIPRSNAKNYGHRDDDSNLAPCCWHCNSSKGSQHLTS